MASNPTCRYWASKRSDGRGYNLRLSIAPDEALDPFDAGEMTLLAVSKETATAELIATREMGYTLRSSLRDALGFTL